MQLRHKRRMQIRAKIKVLISHYDFSSSLPICKRTNDTVHPSYPPYPIQVARSIQIPFPPMCFRKVRRSEKNNKGAPIHKQLHEIRYHQSSSNSLLLSQQIGTVNPNSLLPYTSALVPSLTLYVLVFVLFHACADANRSRLPERLLYDSRNVLCFMRGKCLICAEKCS